MAYERPLVFDNVYFYFSLSDSDLQLPCCQALTNVISKINKGIKCFHFHLNFYFIQNWLKISQNQKLNLGSQTLI